MEANAVIVKISHRKHRHVTAHLVVRGRSYAVDRRYAGGDDRAVVERSFVTKWRANAAAMCLAFRDERRP